MTEKSPPQTMSGEQVNEILRGFADVGGPAGLSLDEDGTCVFREDGGPSVTLLHKAPLPVLVLIVPLLDTDGPTLSLQKALLKANGSWPATGGGIFARSRHDDFLTYCRQIALDSAGAAACLEAIRQVMGFVRELEVDIQFYVDQQGEAGLPRDAGRPGTANPRV